MHLQLIQLVIITEFIHYFWLYFWCFYSFLYFTLYYIIDFFNFQLFIFLSSLISYPLLLIIYSLIPFLLFFSKFFFIIPILYQFISFILIIVIFLSFILYYFILVVILIYPNHYSLPNSNGIKVIYYPFIIESTTKILFII